MPTPVPLPVRSVILRRSQQGQDATTIAHALHLCPRTVRQLLCRFHQQPDSLQPAYRPGPGRPANGSSLYDLAVALRQQHPTWGAGYIRLRLAEIESHQALPTERTLQRWFRQQRQAPAPGGRRPAPETTRATQPHHTWQMDAVEQLRLGSGQGVSWLRLVDECSGAFLDTTVFPPLPVGPRCRVGGPATLARGVQPLGPTALSACG
jgi:hypothetical protein